MNFALANQAPASDLGRMFRILLPLFLGLAGPSLAQSFDCRGEDPLWLLQMDPQEGFFEFRGEKTRFDVPAITEPLNAGGPVGYTLVSDFDSLIVLLYTDLNVTLLTQDRSEPVILAGQCTPA